jgi:asparagine synthase (glutamine-hydrolysing)
MVQALTIAGQGDGFTVSLGSAGIGVQKSTRRLAGIAEVCIAKRPVVLAFYGSLYNLQELVALAEPASNALRGLVRLYVEDGMAFLERLRGEFTLALWDGREEVLHLATDRFRILPLFYCLEVDKLVFASRMRAILACPFPIKRTINPEAIVDVLAASVIPTPKTIFREVKKLPPGHLLTYRRGEVKLAPYWEINFLEADGAAEAELARKLRAHLAEAVSIRLAEDGMSSRIGTFLSGGVDSSTVTGVLAQLTERPLKSFSIGFDEQRFNELHYARIAARAFGAEHYEYLVTPRDTYTAIPVLLEAFDEPFANASAIPTYFCAKLAREHEVDVLYAGDGGDELFAGNERYATQRLFDCYHKLPVWLREPLIKPLVFGLADGFRRELFIKGKKYIQRASIPYPERLSSYYLLRVVPMAELLEDALLEMLGRDYDAYNPIAFYYYKAPARSELERQLYIDLKLAISDSDLFKVTRMAEAACVTVRFPFLDHRLAEFAARVPARVKMRGRHLRSFFKRAYADLLPSEIRAKKKHGFGLPISEWLRTDRRLNEMMHDLVLSPRSIQRGYFRRKALEALVECHKTDETSFYGTALWNLMVLELWHRAHLDGEPPPIV